jgi:hypothetical protein
MGERSRDAWGRSSIEQFEQHLRYGVQTMA